MSWISIFDKVPDNDEYVLTFNEKSSPQINIGYYSTTTKRWFSRSYDSITHWMPLPHNPEEKEI